MTTTSSIVDKIPSNIDIYMKDNNFEHDLAFEDNLGCATDVKNVEDRKSQTPDQPERQCLEKFLEVSKSPTMKEAPDLAVKRLTGIPLLSQLSNQQLAGESLRPNDHQDQVATSEYSGKGSTSISLT